MGFFRDIRSGLSSYATAVLILVRSQMWLALVVPLSLSLGLLWAGEFLADELAKVRFDAITDENASQYLILGVKSILVYLSVYMNKYMVLALLAPVLTTLSAKTEFLLTGNLYKYSLGQYLTDVQRALLISFRNMGILMVWMGIFQVIALLFEMPSYFDDIFYYAVAFYFYGFSFMDYANERRRLNLRETVKFTRKHFGAAYALGAVYGGLFFIPWAGVVVAPILGAIAGTIVVHDLVDLKTNSYAIRPETGGVQVEDAEQEKA